MYAGKMPAIRGGYALSVLLGTRAKKLSKSPKKMPSNFSLGIINVI